MKSTTYNSLGSRMLYDSPLKTLWGKSVFALIWAIIIYMGAPIWKAWLTPLSNIPVVFYGLFMALTGSLIGLLFIRYLDRRDPEPFWLFVGVTVIAMFTTTPPAAFINGISPLPTLTVGLNEEFWKVVPLLLLVFFAPTMVTGMRDGLIFGALGGVGFNITETATYFLRVAYPEQGYAGIYSQLARLEWWGIGSHVFWSALTGAAIGLAVQSDNRRTKIFAPLGAYLLVAFTHLLQDNVVGVILLVGIAGSLMPLLGLDISKVDPAVLMNPGANADVPLALTATTGLSLALEALAINIVTLPILAVALFKSGNWERRVVCEELADESAEVITPEEYARVQAEKRLQLRRIPGYSRRVGRQIRNAQNALAFHKRYLRRRGRTIEEDALVHDWRSEIMHLRSSYAGAHGATVAVGA